MTGPTDVAQFHAEYDYHPDDRIRLFRSIVDFVPATAKVLYPGSYVDIAPSVWFDDVTYLDLDKRAARFFDQTDKIVGLVSAKRKAFKASKKLPSIAFHHVDYQTPIPEPVDSFDLLVSLYAGFISGHCTPHLKPGGLLLVNPSHGDAAMASIDPRYELSGVIESRSDDYRVSTADLDSYLKPKKHQPITISSLHEAGRGVGYTRSPFAYLFAKKH